MMSASRRSDHDVTNTVRVSSAADVRDAIYPLFTQTWPGANFLPVARAFHDLEEACAGRMPGYLGLDTVYHDLQHTLDVTLAMARLMVGYERSFGLSRIALGAERATVGLLLALFHDIGYLREDSEAGHSGAEFTRNHVSRSARFIERYLPGAGFGHWAALAADIVHYTGYERPFEVIEQTVTDPRDIRLGHLLGTADMIAQMADRCYLEKCRDRLYAEFVLGGVALPLGAGIKTVRYASGLDLLRQTPVFIEETRSKRLEKAFRHAYRHIEPLFDGENPYMEAIDRSLLHLKRVLRSESWRMLRRSPQVFVATPDSMNTVRGQMNDYLRKAWTPTLQ
ncbi:MAG: hypothetical protein RL026_54 [Pseudomonadota bacterium]